MIIIEDQQHLAVSGRSGKVVDQRRHQPIEGRRGGRPKQRGDPRSDPRPCLVQRRDSMAPEPRRIAISAVQRQPADRSATTPGPVSQQSRLAEPSRCAQQHEPTRQSVAEPIEQPRARHETGLRVGRIQLRGKQNISLGRGNLE